MEPNSSLRSVIGGRTCTALVLMTVQPLSCVTEKSGLGKFLLMKEKVAASTYLSPHSMRTRWSVRMVNRAFPTFTTDWGLGAGSSRRAEHTARINGHTTTSQDIAMISTLEFTKPTRPLPRYRLWNLQKPRDCSHATLSSTYKTARACPTRIHFRTICEGLWNWHQLWPARQARCFSSFCCLFLHEAMILFRIPTPWFESAGLDSPFWPVTSSEWSGETK